WRRARGLERGLGLVAPVVREHGAEPAADLGRQVGNRRVVRPGLEEHDVPVAVFAEPVARTQPAEPAPTITTSAGISALPEPAARPRSPLPLRAARRVRTLRRTATRAL